MNPKAACGELAGGLVGRRRSSDGARRLRFLLGHRTDKQALPYLSSLWIAELWIASGDRQEAAQTLQRWQKDADLIRVRHPWSLLRFPEVERKNWQQLWQDVDALLKRARDGK